MQFVSCKTDKNFKSYELNYIVIIYKQERKFTKYNLIKLKGYWAWSNPYPINQKKFLEEGEFVRTDHFLPPSQRKEQKLKRRNNGLLIQLLLKPKQSTPN